MGEEYYYREYADSPSQGLADHADETVGRTVLAKAWAKGLTVQGALIGRDKEIPTGAFRTNLGDIRATSNDNRAFLEARYEAGKESTRFNVRGFVDYYHFYGVYPYGAAYLYVDRYSGVWAGLEPRLDQDIGDVATVTVGAETRQFFVSDLKSQEYETLQSDPIGTPLQETPTRQIYSAYGIVDLHPGEVFRLNIGGRLDSYQTTVENFTTFNPRAALILSPGKEVIKAMGGTAFRAPSPYEYFYTDGGISTIAPQSLSPETITTGELEWTHRFDKVVTTTISGYFNTIDSLIDTTVVNAPGLGDVSQYNNIDGAVQSTGLEFEARSSWRSQWMLASQSAVQRTRVGDIFDGALFENSPSWMTSLMGAAPLGGTVRMAHKVRAEAPRLTRTGAYTDISAVWDVTLTGDVTDLGLNYGLGVRNLLDWTVEHPGGPDLAQDVLPQKGRTFFATAKVAF